MVEVMVDVGLLLLLPCGPCAAPDSSRSVRSLLESMRVMRNPPPPPPPEEARGEASGDGPLVVPVWECVCVCVVRSERGRGVLVVG